MTLAFGQSEDVQIELIQQHDEARSGYQDFLDSGREGPQHVAFWFDDPVRYDAAYRRLIDEGLFVSHEGAGGGARFAYFSRGDDCYPEMELAEPLLPNQNGWFEFIATLRVG